jgi:hypothetical protein
LTGGARLLYDILNARRYESDSEQLREFAYTTGLRTKDLRELERILSRDDLMRLLEMFKEGKITNFSDKR